MANIYRQRIRIGYEENGKALFKDIRTHTAEEMQEKIVQTFVECGRIRDFLSDEWQYNPKTEEAESTAILFRDYAEEWLNTYKVKKVKPTTLNGYRSYLLHHFNPFFGDLPIDTITTTKIQEFLNERSHLARKTLQDQLKFFRSIMHSALEDGHIVNDPSVSKRLVIPSEKVTHREALPLAKTQDVVENLDKLCLEDRRMVALMIFTGMRRGEVLGTMWEDLNYQDAIINVQRNVTFSENQPTIGTPKSKSGTREVPLPNELIEQLQPLEQSGFIIGGEKPLSCQQFQNRWNRIKRTINLHGASPHIFRHSYLTYLAGSGVDVKTLQGIAGHADVQMTMNRYVHTQLENIQEAGKKLGNILSMNTDAVGKSDGNNKESKS